MEKSALALEKETQQRIIERFESKLRALAQDGGVQERGWPT
jgi:hypothetical protein